MIKASRNLYAFLTGMMLAFDFTGMLSGIHISKAAPSQSRSDLENLKADMERIGQDFQKALVNCHE